MTKIRLTIFCCLVCCLNICLAQTTSYYKLTRQIVDGRSSTNVSGGQFITFNKDKCYESDKDGFTVDNGVLLLNETYDGITIYSGKSYWGNSFFRFNSDKSVLNVNANGNTYVYKRITAPAGVITCSLIKKKSSGGGIVSPPVSIGGGGYGNNIGGSNNNSSTSTTTGQNGKRVEKVWHDCPLCNGKGRVPHESNAGRFGLSNDYKVYCSECGREFWKSTGHTHVTCRQCKGKRGYYTER